MIDMLSLFIGLAAGVVVGSIVVYLLPYRGLRREHGRLQTELAETQLKNNELQATLLDVQTAAYQERQAALQRATRGGVAWLLHEGHEGFNAHLGGVGVDPFGELVQCLGWRGAGHARGSWWRESESRQIKWREKILRAKKMARKQFARHFRGLLSLCMPWPGHDSAVLGF